MITMYVTYAGDKRTAFDHDHWLNIHLPLVRECWGPHGLVSVSGFFPQGDGGGIIAIAPCVFRDEAAMNAALASPDTARVMADVEKVTDVEPQRSVARTV